MENLAEQLTNELNNLDIMSKDESTILDAFGNFLFDLVAKVNLAGENSITDVYYTEQLETIMNKLKENPFLPKWVYEKFEGEDPEKVLSDFSNLIQNEIKFSSKKKEKWIWVNPSQIKLSFSKFKIEFEIFASVTKYHGV